LYQEMQMVNYYIHQKLQSNNNITMKQ